MTTAGRSAGRSATICLSGSSAPAEPPMTIMSRRKPAPSPRAFLTCHHAPVRGGVSKDVRAEVVGSLLRPEYLVSARQQLEKGELDPARFKKLEDRAVDEAVALQTGAGIDVITDGEQRRYAFFGHLVDAMAGFDKFGGWAIPFRDEKGEELVFKRPVVVEKLRPLRNMAAEEFTYLRAKTRAPVKVTMISAQQAAAYYDPEKSKGAYPTRDAYPAEIVELRRREVEAFIPLCCPYI